jgi:hypothetical protein
MPHGSINSTDTAAPFRNFGSRPRLLPLGIRTGVTGMTNAFVGPRPKGKREGTPIRDFVVEDRADHVLATLKTQEEAILWARTHGYLPHVARVRHFNDKKKADQWRRV